MSRWNGAAGKGAMRAVREAKRTEAEVRAAEARKRFHDWLRAPEARVSTRRFRALERRLDAWFDNQHP